jgi:hypothetical protein
MQVLITDEDGKAFHQISMSELPAIGATLDILVEGSHEGGRIIYSYKVLSHHVGYRRHVGMDRSMFDFCRVAVKLMKEIDCEKQSTNGFFS